LAASSRLVMFSTMAGPAPRICPGPSPSQCGGASLRPLGTLGPTVPRSRGTPSRPFTTLPNLRTRASRLTGRPSRKAADSSMLTRAVPCTGASVTGGFPVFRTVMVWTRRSSYPCLCPVWRSTFG
jgi:hypothetical protein